MTKFRFINSPITSAQFSGQVLSYTVDGITRTAPRLKVSLVAADTAPEGYIPIAQELAKCLPIPVVLTIDGDPHDAAMCRKDYEAGVYILRQGVVRGSDSVVTRVVGAAQRGINSIASICGGCSK